VRRSRKVKISQPREVAAAAAGPRKREVTVSGTRRRLRAKTGRDLSQGKVCSLSVLRRMSKARDPTSYALGS
jgi:hypothetical protein